MAGHIHGVQIQVAISNTNKPDTIHNDGNAEPKKKYDFCTITLEGLTHH